MKKKRFLQNSIDLHSSTIWSFESVENQHSLYLREDYMKTFCSSLREQATNLISFEKKKILPLTKKN